MNTNKPIQITNKLLVAEFGATEPWWNRRRPRLAALGILHKEGRKFFGSLEDVGAYLLGSHSGEHANDGTR